MSVSLDISTDFCHHRAGSAIQHRGRYFQQDLRNRHECFRTAGLEEEDHGTVLARDQRLHTEDR